MIWFYCCSCGCGHPHDPHNNLANIVASDLKRAARAAGISMRETAENIKKTVDQLPDADEKQKSIGH